MAGIKDGHFILTGDINTGKTTRLLAFIDKISILGINFSGVVSKPVFSGLTKCGYNLSIIDSSKTIMSLPLARNSEHQGWQQFGNWWFDPNAFATANDFKFSKCELFVIDEIGPLEINKHMGFTPLLDHIYKENSSTLTVVRRSLAEKFSELLKNAGCRTCILDEIDSIIT